MKKMNLIKKAIAVLTGTMLVCSSLTGCGSSASADAAVPEPSPVTVTFMNQDTTLGSVSANAGEVLDPASYSAFEAVEGMEFGGWYETPTLLAASLKDLTSATFDADTVLYGDFKNLNVTEDTRKWYIAGSSTKGTLALNNWASNLSDEEKASFELTKTGNATNEFQLTIDLFEGDMFQIIHDWSWDGQKGFGKFTEIDETQMENGGGLAGSADKANVNVLVDGNYTITLTTDPDNAAQDTLSIVRNSDPLTSPEEAEAEPFEITADTTVKVKGSWVADWSDLKELERKDDTGIFTISLDLEKDTELCFSVFEGSEDTGIVLKEENVDDASKALLADNGNNIQVPESGTYNFELDLSSMTVKVSK